MSLFQDALVNAVAVHCLHFLHAAESRKQL